MFRTITRQLRLARDVVASILALAGAVAAVLDPQLRAHLREGETLDGIGMILVALGRWLRADHERLEGLESAHRDSLRRLKKLRIRRGAGKKRLYGVLLRVRKLFEDTFGRGTAAVYLGLDPRLGAVGNSVLRRYAHGAIGSLSNPELATPEPVDDDPLWGDPERYVKQIRTALESFEDTLAEITAEEKQAEVALKAKSELLAELKQRLKWSIRFAEAAYHLAGMGFHAERLRPPEPSRPKAKESEPAEGPDDGTGAADAPDSPT